MSSTVADAPWLLRPRRIRFLDLVVFLVVAGGGLMAAGAASSWLGFDQRVLTALAEPGKHVFDLLILLAAVFGVIFFAVLVAIARHGRVAFWLLGFRRSGWRWWVGGAIGIVILSVLLARVALPLVEQETGIDPRMSTQDLIRQLLPDARMALWATLVIGVWAPLVEELVFRGLVFGWLIGRFPGWLAVIGSALLFGLAHVEPVHAVLAGVLGLWLGMLRLKSGSIWPSIFAHMANNSAFVWAMYLVPDA
jgi:membrane protease YdiL (CAAX protease family)